MSRKFDQHVIIQTLDNSPRVLFWDMDEFLVLFSPLFIGVALGSILVMGVGFLAKPLYMKIKRRSKRGFIFRHRLYWLLPKSLFVSCGVLKRAPASYIRTLSL